MANPRRSTRLWLTSILLFVLTTTASAKGCTEVERDALLTFRARIVDPSHRLSSWRRRVDCCRWNGVVCDDTTGRVVELNLQNSEDMSSESNRAALRGEISPSLLSLTHLDRLDLNHNDFGGSPIPTFLGSFPKLTYLNLSWSNFSGAIPPQLGNLSSLRSLDLHSYGLSSDRLHWLSRLSSLRYLDMSGVNLSMASHDWLHSMNMLSSLEELYLPYCGLTELPSSLSHVNLTTLTIIDLRGNLFNSTFPNWLLQLRSLSNLALSDSKLLGELPAGIGRLTRLTQLDLSTNSLSGLLPAEIWSSRSLTSIDLSFNSFRGPVQVEAGNRTSLSHVYLINCSLTGRIPAAIGSLTRLKELHLSGNRLTGPIPAEIGNLTALTTLDLGQNSLYGSVPPEIGKLSNLTSLDLSLNSLKGTMSELHFANLAKLDVLYLYRNSLDIAIGHDWIPPFQLETIGLDSCKLGPSFPGWLRSQGSIVDLNLSNTSIEDTLPDWFWNSSSSSIMVINLSHNKISGTLPASLESLTNLMFLNLSSNLFQGLIPVSPPILQALDLSSNALSGPLPLTFAPVSEYLFFSNNHINGSIPSYVCTLQQLFALDLSNNRISGEIPRCWQETNELLFINLANNKLGGKIPNSIGNLTNLEFLHLNNNSLLGYLPPSLQNCSQLAVIDLGRNHFWGNIPAWIGQSFRYLEVLLLRSNMLSGNIPPQLGQLSNLQIIDFADNKLSGIIPRSFGNFSAIISISKSMSSSISTDPNFELSSFVASESIALIIKGHERKFSSILHLVKSIDLSKNSLTGAIPTEIGYLYALQTLNLSRNSIGGMIPSTIGGMKSLETLDLSFNDLSGSIPQSFSGLNYLSDLNLSYNNLSGAIPSGYQLQTLPASSYIGNAYLCGPPVSKSCLEKTNINATYEEEEEGFHAFSFYFGVTLGYLVGQWCVFMIMLFKKDWRMFYFRMIDRLYDKAYVAIKIKINGWRINKGERRTEK
ncbi:receptor-like protein EIX2 [Musa acuminata AAA Group]|uniref:receptor-like protein EIX2 n=1 Tax=Musa acuminata AAA Group TaxID=214697 RepID=UPI0031D4BBE2